MGLLDDLAAEVSSIFSSRWAVEETALVPAPEDLRLNSNHAKVLSEATVLYADMNGSTKMVDTQHWEVSAEIYKAFLRCSAQLIRSENGVITAYDGDRVMAIFTGDSKNTSAVRCALKINYAAKEVIQPRFAKQYPNSGFTLKHVVGVDSSLLRASRIGVRGDNDIVWVGKAANHAAKLTELGANPTWITKAVHDRLHASVKLLNGAPIWKEMRWTSMNDAPVFCSDHYCTLA